MTAQELQDQLLGISKELQDIKVRLANPELLARRAVAIAMREVMEWHRAGLDFDAFEAGAVADAAVRRARSEVN